MRWKDEGQRAAYRCGNPTSLSTPNQRGGMKLISPIRTLHVLPLAPHLFAWTTDRFFLSASSTTLSAALLLSHPLSRACPHPLDSPAQPGHTFTLFLSTIELT